MIKLVEVVQTYKKDYNLREIFVNPDHVVLLREDTTLKSRLDEGKGSFPEGLDTRQSFTRLQIHNGTTGAEFIVIGAPHLIELKLKGNKKELLRG
tara:strand:- start:340 stop:624 length:285 start_codon:yes stop_codon:yes gene_type:complete